MFKLNQSLECRIEEQTNIPDFHRIELMTVFVTLFVLVVSRVCRGRICINGEFFLLVMITVFMRVGIVTMWVVAMRMVTVRVVVVIAVAVFVCVGAVVMAMIVVVTTGTSYCEYKCQCYEEIGKFHCEMV